jgi:non-specific serine/threonine protein kinase
MLDRVGHAHATATYGESLALYRELGDPWGVAAAARGQAFGNMWGPRADRDHDLVMALLVESLAAGREQGDRWNIASTLSALGFQSLHRGDHGRAAMHFEEDLALTQEMGDRSRLPSVLHGLAQVAWRQGRLDQAIALYEGSLTVAGETGDRQSVANAYWYLAGIARNRGEPWRAVALIQDSLRVSGEIGDVSDIASCLVPLAALLGTLGQPAQAARFIGMAEGLWEGIGQPVAEDARADHERSMAAARGALGDAASAATRAAGKAVPLEQVVAEALSLTVESDAIETISSGVAATDHGLSPRELDVLRLLAEGCSNRTIADALFISVPTVKVHVRSLLTKLGLESRTAAAAWAVRHGLAEPGSQPPTS